MCLANYTERWMMAQTKARRQLCAMTLEGHNTKGCTQLQTGLFLKEMPEY